MKKTKKKLMIIFLIVSLFLFAVLPNYATSTRAEKCKKNCPTPVSFTGYLPKNFTVRLATKEGLIEEKIKVTTVYSDGNFDYDIEKVGEIDSLTNGNGITYYALVNFTLPVVTNISGQNFLRSWDCQAAITTEQFWKGDCTAITFNKFGKLEFTLAPFTLERK